MKIERYKAPKSSFLSVDKDISKITDMLLENERLKRLIYRTGKDPMNAENLTELETINLLEDLYIRKAPRIAVEQEVSNYIIIQFDNFVPSANPEFRDNLISINIVCHYDQWNIANNQLRPYRIAGEIDSMLNEARLSGIGTLEFISANVIRINPEFGGINLLYAATHGEDDKQGFENPNDEEQFLQEFAEMLNING
jgi:hypothetical protein